VDIDVIEHPLKKGDRFLLCSDGLSNLVDDGEIEETVGNLELREACENLIKSANSQGGDDNITVVLMQVDEIA